MTDPQAAPRRPPSAGRRGRALALAVLMHGGLIAMLVVGLQWVRKEPEPVQVELWVPPTAKPTPEPTPAPEPASPPEPTPPPPEPEPVPEPVKPPPPRPEPPPPVQTPPPAKAVPPDIKAEQVRERARREEAALRLEEKKRAEERHEAEVKKAAEQRAAEIKRAQAEQAKREAEKARREAEQAKREAAEKAKREAEQAKREAERLKAARAAAEEKRQAELARKDAEAAEKRRLDDLRRLQAQAGNPGVAADQAQRGAPVGRMDAAYGARLGSAIRANTTYQLPANLEGNPKAVFAVQLRPDCSLVSIKLKRASGLPAWDQAAERGIQRTDPFPRPAEGNCPAEVEISRGPKDER